MSKIAQYLNEHIQGSVSGLTTLRAKYANDKSVLSIAPELIVYPRVTSDVRKIARFSWQLAEKGHTLSLTPRGYGRDTTGGAIGGGLVIDMGRHLDSVLYLSAKDKNKIAHVQPGLGLRSLHETLRWHGVTIGAFSPDMSDMTVGGAIASGAATYRSGKHGTVADAVERMEVVLANGDLMEVGRVNKREVNKKQGEQTLEGEIYRQIDALIEENSELIGQLSSEGDNLGYRIDQVKGKDGSFDLTPLFIGSQGTLGIISEVVLRLSFYSEEETALVVECQSLDDARGVADALSPLDPAALRIIEGAYFTAARARGKKFIFDSETQPTHAVYASFDDFSEKARVRKLKKAVKLLSKQEIAPYTSLDHRIESLQAVRDVGHVLEAPRRADEAYVSICDGAYIPDEAMGEFAKEVASLAEKHRIEMPLIFDPLSGLVWTKSLLHLKKVADKQKVFKVASEYAALVLRMKGTPAGAHAEGRLGAYAAYSHLNPEAVALYEKVRKIFDPFGTLNPGVKQAGDLRVLARQLKTD